VSVVAQRGLVIVVAVLTAAWLAVSYANSHVIRQAQIVIGDRKASPARVEAALRDVRSGQTLDPSRGTESLSYQAALEIRLRRIPEALRTIEAIVKREPDTAEAWFLIAQLSRASDPALSARAEAQLRRLDPRVVRKGR
jgi:hypothetical protein